MRRRDHVQHSHRRKHADSSEPCAYLSRTLMGVRSQSLMFFLGGQADPELADWFCAEKRCGGAKRSRRSSCERNEKTGHGRRCDQYRFSRPLVGASFGRVLAPGPISIADETLHKTAEESCCIEGVDGCSQNDCIGSFDVCEYGFQIIVLQTFSASF